MRTIKAFIAQYKESFTKEKPVFDDSLLGLLKSANYTLLHEEQNPSLQLNQELNKLQIRAEEPMKVAITGQFSSGKSTFLNALLAKSVLPTGITPVTSKVNYIRYGEEFKLKVTYRDGREEFHGIDNIKGFTDQRGAVEDIAFLTLYSPLDILKDIVFVDTPGLNSQADVDTETTEAVLKEVDGIIWLTLIDNAGKLSEAQVLDDYLNAYQNKSLCVLNQKDKFSHEQVETTTNYIKEKFAKYFSEVVPISAIQALESRSHDKNRLIEEEIEHFSKALEQKLKAKQESEDILVAEGLRLYKQKVGAILSQDLSNNIALLKESNIEKVLDFIRTEIQPKSVESKEYAIKKDLHHICDTLINQHELFLKIYDELAEILQNFLQEATKEFEALNLRFSRELKNAFSKIEGIIEKIANEIYANVTTEKRVRYYEKTKGLLKSKSIEQTEYEACSINSSLIFKALFFDDEIVPKMFKKYVRALRVIQDDVNRANEAVYEELELELRRWQKPYELIRKQEAICSDIEFANIRKFASKAYENFLKAFNDEIRLSFAKVSMEFNHLSSAVNFNYQNATGVCVANLEKKIEDSIKLFEKEPTKFSIFQPDLNEIKQRLNTNFHLYELENMMNTDRTFISKNYTNLQEKFLEIEAKELRFIEEVKERYIKQIQLLTDFKTSIDAT